MERRIGVRIQEGFIVEKDLANLVAKEFGYRKMSLKRTKVKSSAVESLPRITPVPSRHSRTDWMQTLFMAENEHVVFGSIGHRTGIESGPEMG
jgi:hypothetical protein